MDLRNQFPRSPKEKLDGYVHVLRIIDKARAHNAGTLGEYLYNCPMDQSWFQLTGIAADAFAEAVKTRDDQQMAEWIRQRAKAHSQGEIESWNRTLLARTPSSPESLQRFLATRQKLAPKRTDITTWPDLIDLEEGRPVPRRDL
ncbi:MAG TPA: DUF5069 domain-containing protein [Nitrospiria bacterium]|nr:DUF5069 domain-containing protein [Nitrospiria bacterium]